MRLSHGCRLSQPVGSVSLSAQSWLSAQSTCQLCQLVGSVMAVGSINLPALSACRLRHGCRLSHGCRLNQLVGSVMTVGSVRAISRCASAIHVRVCAARPLCATSRRKQRRQSVTSVERDSWRRLVTSPRTTSSRRP